jgi:hypothetical protein
VPRPAGNQAPKAADRSSRKGQGFVWEREQRSRQAGGKHPIAGYGADPVPPAACIFTPPRHQRGLRAATEPGGSWPSNRKPPLGPPRRGPRDRATGRRAKRVGYPVEGGGRETGGKGGVVVPLPARSALPPPLPCARFGPGVAYAAPGSRGARGRTCQVFPDGARPATGGKAPLRMRASIPARPSVGAWPPRGPG